MQHSYEPNCGVKHIFRQSFSQMLATDEVKAGGPTLVRPGLSADVYSGKAVMMRLMGPLWQEVAGHSGLAEGCFEIPWKGHSGSR